MSEHAEKWALREMSARFYADPCVRRRVLMHFAELHEGGPLKVETADLAETVRCSDPMKLWPALMDLRKAGLIDFSNFGGRMTVTLALDFPEKHPAYVSASPEDTQEASA